MERFRELSFRQAIRSCFGACWKILFDQRLLQFANLLSSILLQFLSLGVLQFVVGFSLQWSVERIGRWFCEDNRSNASLLRKIQLQSTESLDVLMSEHDRVAHFLFRNLLTETFDHQNSLLRTSHDQVELAGLHLFNSWHQNQLIIQHANSDCSDRAFEWQARNHQCRASGGDVEYVRIVFTVTGHDVAHDLDFVTEPFWKQRTNWTVRQAAGQNFASRRATFAFQITTGKATGCSEAFTVINGEREKIGARTRWT